MKVDGKHVGYIYSISNKQSGKKYIGLTIQDINIRWNQHKTSYKSLISQAIHLEGVNNFLFEIEETEVCYSEEGLRESLSELEKFYIKTFDTLENGYNSTSGGCSGYVVSEETRRKHIESNNKRVINLNTGEIYCSAKEVAIKSGIRYNSVSTFIKKQYRCLGNYYRYLSTDEVLSDSNRLKELEILNNRRIDSNKKTNIANSKKNCKTVVCVDTGQIFESATEASKNLGKYDTAVAASIRKKQKCAGYTFEYI